ncbi:MAG: nitroreductase [Agarilytica sp.]
MNNDALELLLTRRSVKAVDLCEPGPNKGELKKILAAGHRVPDHGKIGPWRFVIMEGNARTRFGETTAQIFNRANPGASEKLIEFEKQRFTRAPLVIVVIASPIEHKVPEWEQVLSAGACCQNILNAAHALGYGAQWLTEWTAYDADVLKHLELGERENIAGFMYIGSYSNKPDDRVRPSLEDRVQYLKA